MNLRFQEHTMRCMFYCAQAMLLTKNLSFSSHKGVISAFEEHFVKNGCLPERDREKVNRAFEKRQLGKEITNTLL